MCDCDEPDIDEEDVPCWACGDPGHVCESYDVPLCEFYGPRTRREDMALRMGELYRALFAPERVVQLSRQPSPLSAWLRPKKAEVRGE